MGPRIASIDADEILDSRGRPTVRVFVGLSNNALGVACVPSGASTGVHEAHELRDDDPQRYGGKGVLTAVENVRSRIGPLLIGADPADQAGIDAMMIDLDGTDNKSGLGANAIVGVSMAVARAAAKAQRLPLYRSLNAKSRRLPVPMMNVINGGKHAASGLAFQEFMIVPHGAPSFAEALRYGSECFWALRGKLEAAGHSTAVGDEGGFAPHLRSERDACELIVSAIEAAGFRPGDDVAIALDPAASSFWEEGFYRVPSLGLRVDAARLQELYEEWSRLFPIVSIEDGFDENDWGAFQTQTKRMGAGLQIVGDDIFVTNPRLIDRGVEERTANAVLIKLNQIGTVTETIAAIERCRAAGWNYIISHRSGETEDTFIADFAVAMGGGQIKTGSLCRSERIAKYNRLLRIERDLGAEAEFVGPFRSGGVGAA